MAEKVDAVLAEIEAREATMIPEREGLRDLAVLNLQPETLHEIALATTDYDRRLALQAAAKAALIALRADGYPDMPPIEIPESAFVNIKENKATIDAIYGRFVPAASAMTVTGGAVVPKP